MQSLVWTDQGRLGYGGESKILSRRQEKAIRMTTEQHNHDEPKSVDAVKCEAFNEGYAYAIERITTDLDYRDEILFEVTDDGER